LPADPTERTPRVAPEPEAIRTLPPPAERIDAQAFLRDTTASVAEKEERPTSVGERLRRWLSRNQEREDLQDDPRPRVPESLPEETPSASEGAARETSKFTWEESVPVVPDFPVRSGPTAILRPETQPGLPDASAAVESQVSVTRDEDASVPHAAGRASELEWELPRDEGLPEMTSPNGPVPEPETTTPAPTAEATTPAPMAASMTPTPMTAPMAASMTPTPMTAPMTPVPMPESPTPAAPRRVHPVLRSGAPRPREVIVPIEIHPEDLERGITLKLAIQAPWWQERDEDEEAREAA
jgi:hypothetical protein